MTKVEQFRADHGVELGRDAWIALVPAFVIDHASVFATILAELPLAPESLRIFGKDVLTPREVAYVGDAHAEYVYSGTLHVPRAWTPAVARVRDALEVSLGVRFDAVLVNHYRTGDDAMGWHADDEAELGPAAPHDVLIASVSLGDHRKFRLKPKKASSPLPAKELLLGEGSLLVMGGATQREMVHALPRTARSVGPRLNLTFRQVRGAR